MSYSSRLLVEPDVHIMGNAARHMFNGTCFSKVSPRMARRAQRGAKVVDQSAVPSVATFPFAALPASLQARVPMPPPVVGSIPPDNAVLYASCGGDVFCHDECPAAVLDQLWQPVPPPPECRAERADKHFVIVEPISELLEVQASTIALLCGKLEALQATSDWPVFSPSPLSADAAEFVPNPVGTHVGEVVQSIDSNGALSIPDQVDGDHDVKLCLCSMRMKRYVFKVAPCPANVLECSDRVVPLVARRLGFLEPADLAQVSPASIACFQAAVMGLGLGVDAFGPAPAVCTPPVSDQAGTDDALDECKQQ